MGQFYKRRPPREGHRECGQTGADSLAGFQLPRPPRRALPPRLSAGALLNWGSQVSGGGRAAASTLLQSGHKRDAKGGRGAAKRLEEAEVSRKRLGVTRPPGAEREGSSAPASCLPLAPPWLFS